MHSRERLRRAYYHEEMDRPGVYSRTGYPANDPSYDRVKAYLAGHSELKRSWNGRACETPSPLERVVEPCSADYERHQCTLHTPAGDLRASTLASLRGQPGLGDSFFIKTRQDASKYLSLPLPQVGGDTGSFHDLDRQVGVRGIVDVSLGFNPAGFVAELCGSATFALMSVTDRDIIHALCQRQMELMIATVEFLLSRGVGPFFSMAGEEYVVPPLHGPTDFCDFNVRYDRPIIDLIHDAGGRIHIHCHGQIKRVMRGFIDVGADVLHPFEAPPMGDITAEEAKEVARGRLCLEGNIQINRMYECTPDEIRQETIALIASAFDDGRGLIVCPTASPYIRGAGETCYEQYKAMIDTVLEWRG